MGKTAIKMNEETFKAFIVEEKLNGEFEQQVKQVPFSFLPDNEVLIKVQYSSLNYKDGLSASGNKGITRKYPHIPGIDASGIIEEDASGTFSKGKKVIVTGQDLGSNIPGGYGAYIRVPHEWVVPLPDGLELKSAMMFGTAGFTAMYGVIRLQRELIFPKKGKVLVTGATGGVGSMAVFFLAQLGYHVVAATGKMDRTRFLKNLGAEEVIHRDEITDVKENLLLSRRWIAAIETVGGRMLDAVIRQTSHDGAVACCGNILGDQLTTNIYPFILRGVSLLGIDSAICEMPLRLKIWERISKSDLSKIPNGYTNICSLEELKQEIETTLNGRQTGRVIIAHDE